MLFQPIRKNNDARFVPLVLVHDRDEGGEQMMLRLRSIAWQRLKFNALLVCPTFTGAYAFLQNGGGEADRLLLDAIAAQTEVSQITDRMLVFGFGDGAQFAHRFTLQHPRRVAGCAALSGGSWTDPHGFCTGPMIKAGGLDEPPFDTDAVHNARKAACPEPTALPGVRWLVGASSDAPDYQAAAEHFRGDVARAHSQVEALQWDGEPHRVPTPQQMTALAFFNDVVAKPAALPPAPPEPVKPAPEPAVEEMEMETETDAVPETEPASAAADASVAEAPAPIPAPAPAPKAEPDVAEAASAAETRVDADPMPGALGPDDSDAPETATAHGRADAGAALTARERARLTPKPAAPPAKPGDGNGFFDQLLRQQAPRPGGESTEA